MSTNEEKEAIKREEERLARALDRKKGKAAGAKPAWKLKLEEEEARRKVQQDEAQKKRDESLAAIKAKQDQDWKAKQAVAASAPKIDQEAEKRQQKEIAEKRLKEEREQRHKEEQAAAEKAKEEQFQKQKQQQAQSQTNASKKVEETIHEPDVEVVWNEEEYLKLKRQLTAKSLSSSSQEELENRLQAITEHLIQKQNHLETLASEKAYLQLQLEAALQNHTPKTVTDDRHSILIDDGSASKKRSKRKDDARLRPIASLVDSNSNSAIGRRVVGAANFIDSVSTLTGRFLGQAPMARLAVIFYMLTLHFWVFYVFWTWNPEIHKDKPI